MEEINSVETFYSEQLHAMLTQFHSLTREVVRMVSLFQTNIFFLFSNYLNTFSDNFVNLSINIFSSLVFRIYLFLGVFNSIKFLLFITHSLMQYILKKIILSNL